MTCSGCSSYLSWSEPLICEGDGSVRGQQALAGDSLYVPVIGPATAAKDLYLGMASTQCPIAQREVAGVAGIQRGHRVEFGMAAARCIRPDAPDRSEEHTSELQSLMRISYAVFCLKKKNTIKKTKC